jgi:arylsulfatase A-like enzyme
MAEDDPQAVNCKINEPMDKFVWAAMAYSSRFNEEPLFEPDGHVTEYLAREAAAAITVNKDHPFFMYLSFTAMHTPLQALRTDYDALPHIEDHCARVYAAMLVALDRGIGTVLNALKHNGLTDNTMVLFTSDNGAPGYIGLRDLNYPLRGFKGTFFEGGIRVPFFVKYPGHIAPGTRVDEMVSHVDIFPTIMAQAGVEVTHEIDGIDILPYASTTHTGAMGGEKEGDVNDVPVAVEKHETLFWRSGHYMSLRMGDFKIKRSGNPNKVWLFDLHNDPQEKVNLAINVAAEHADILRDMLHQLDTENAKQSAPNWPCLSESPILVDKLASGIYEEGDEYIYWPN